MERWDQIESVRRMGPISSLFSPRTHDELGTVLGRREALGLSLFGALGLSMIGSWLVRGDTVASATPSRPASADLAGRPFPAQATGPSQLPSTRPAHEWIRRAHAPLYRVHDLIPNAPKRAVALTIDDGPDPTWTPRVLDLLARHEVAATFCLVGVQVRRHPDLVREIVEAGHQIADHSMRHPGNLCRLPEHRIDAEISEAHKLIREVSGMTPKLFRAPGGVWSRRLLRSVTRHGMLPLDWNIDPRDWSRPGVDHIAHVLLRAKPGDILLCHDGGGDRSETLRALHTVIPRLKRRDLEFISL
ncbi:MAG TPA: polysaccharide deacetylase family protein [Streptosporangiaceae bacterium]|jgi:peptidoglycan/xylan/chitin deacetylase (PgdA/CDA1 family)|nr:polysaccharide deacetylase family protein [Streptosporangiaceae bacterium]